MLLLDVKNLTTIIIKTATSNKNELSERIKKKLKQDQQKDQEMI